MKMRPTRVSLGVATLSMVLVACSGRPTPPAADTRAASATAMSVGMTVQDLSNQIWSGSCQSLKKLVEAGGGPTYLKQSMLNGARSFIGSQIFWLGVAPLWTVLCLSVLLIARLVVRRANVAWAVFALLMVGYGYLMLRAGRPATISPLLLFAVAGFFWLLLVWLLWKHGALALAVAFFVEFLVEQAPWTLDMSRWYAWRGPFVIAVIAALAFWGFRNALGRQPAFPAGALDG